MPNMLLDLFFLDGLYFRFSVNISRNYLQWITPSQFFFVMDFLFVNLILLLTKIDLNRLCSLINIDGVTHSHQHSIALQGREGFRKKIPQDFEINSEILVEKV